MYVQCFFDFEVIIMIFKDFCWIGVWWFGFFMFGIMVLVVFLLVFFFLWIILKLKSDDEFEFIGDVFGEVQLSFVNEIIVLELLKGIEECLINVYFI